MDRFSLVLALLLASAAAPAQPDGRELYQQAASAEQSGNLKEAVRLYVRAARSGDGKSAARLAEIHEAQKWRDFERVLRERMIGDFPDPKRAY